MLLSGRESQFVMSILRKGRCDGVITRQEPALFPDKIGPAKKARWRLHHRHQRCSAQRPWRRPTKWQLFVTPGGGDPTRAQWQPIARTKDLSFQQDRNLVGCHETGAPAPRGIHACKRSGTPIFASDLIRTGRYARQACESGRSTNLDRPESARPIALVNGAAGSRVASLPSRHV